MELLTTAAKRARVSVCGRLRPTPFQSQMRIRCQQAKKKKENRGKLGLRKVQCCFDEKLMGQRMMFTVVHKFQARIYCRRLSLEANKERSNGTVCLLWLK